MQSKVLVPLRLSTIPNKTLASKVMLPLSDVQPDLLYMDSVLVSTGKNKNDDVFLSEETWKARGTPILKPVDWEHNTGREKPEHEAAESKNSIIFDNQIIGVMYNSYIALKDGSIIDDKIASATNFEVPSQFDIINQAVIYKYLYPKTAARIVREAENNTLFVSMEAWFSDYDYQVGNKIVARNEETAFLDTYLRAKGGTGTFNDVEVGRVLRNFVFGGVGIVSNPANKDSIINSFTNASHGEINNDAIVSNVIGRINGNVKGNLEVIEIMDANKENAPATTSVSTAEYQDVVKTLVKAQHELEVKQSELAESAKRLEKLESSVESLTSYFASGAEQLGEALGADSVAKLQKSDVKDFFPTLAAQVAQKLEAIANLSKELEEAKATIENLEVEKRAVSRRAEISKLLSEYIEDADALSARENKMVEATKSLSDESFAETLSDTKELLGLAMKKDKAEDMKDKKGEKDKPEEEVDAGITDASILDHVETATASVTPGGDVAPDNGSEAWKSLANTLLNYGKDK